MKAYILAAGIGTRLFPLTLKIPKIMLPVGPKPVLWYQLKHAKFYQVDEVMINLYKNSKSITNYFGNGDEIGIKINYAYEKRLLGTAGSIKRAQKFFDNGTFLVLYGDTLRDTNLKKLISFHQQKGSFCTIDLYQSDEPTTQGITEVDKGSRVISIIEKPKENIVTSKLSNSGVLVCEPEIFDYIPKDKFADFGYDVLPKLIKFEKVYAIKTNNYIQDIGTPSRYKKAQADFEKGKINFAYIK